MKAGRRALLSVSDKRDLVPFARELVQFGFELVSTGGTAQALRQAGLAVREIASLTGMPELLGGRVKTLHPTIHAAILARDSASDREELERHGIEPIDLVAVDLYPFERAAERGGPLESLLEQIDIGGSTLLRAAAKNWPRVVVVPGREHYERVLAALRSTGEVGAGLRRTLALRAFERSAAYDAAIAAAWAMRTGEAQPAPERLVRLWRRERPLRYGENPHQAAVLYRAPYAPPETLARAVPLQGKPLSYNNLLDAHAAWSLLGELSGDRHAAVIVKHTNPCGAAVADTIEQAYEAALATDPRSAFGGVLALSAAPGPALASRIAARFFELLLAPEFDPEARTELARRPALRLLALGPPHRPAPCWTGREIEGGLLWQ
ncbi:MAG: bifunctional phosphoribosylaminoimidazolecarboxamide formyltransferase/IMP cyclohydrolase PurH, partial [Planctomycetota bacterium]